MTKPLLPWELKKKEKDDEYFLPDFAFHCYVYPAIIGVYYKWLPDIKTGQVYSVSCYTEINRAAWVSVGDFDIAVSEVGPRYEALLIRAEGVLLSPLDRLALLKEETNKPRKE